MSSEYGEFEILVTEGWIDDFVASVFQEGRLDAAWNAVPAVEEQNLHGSEPQSHFLYRYTHMTPLSLLSPATWQK